MPKKIAIIGSGISGLVCAYRLLELSKHHQRSLEVALFEKSDRVGGSIETEVRDGFTLEKGPDSFISEKPAAVELCKELGLESEIIGTSSTNRKSFVAQGNKLVPVPNGFYLIAPTQIREFLKSPILSWRGKLRVLAEVFVPREAQRDDETVASFVRRRLGEEALEKIGQPMLAGIYTGDPEKLSLGATMPRFLQLEKKYGSVIRGMLAEMRKRQSGIGKASGPRYSLFLSFKNGMETLTQTLAAQIPSKSVHLESKLNRIYYNVQDEKWVVLMQNGQEYVADAVCISTSARSAAMLLERSFARLTQRLMQIEYESVATINLAFHRDQILHPLDGFGFVVPKTGNRSLVACSFSSQKFAGRAPEGKVLLRAFVGGAFGRDFFYLNDGELVNAALEDLRELLGIRGDPIFSVLQRHPDAMVQYNLGHLGLVNEIESEVQKIKGLRLTGSSYRGVGIPDCVDDASKKAELIFTELLGSSD